MKAPATTDSLQQASAVLSGARRKQERLRAELSPPEYEQYRKRKKEDFLKTSAEMAAEAQANGLTEEILAEILAEE